MDKYCHNINKSLLRQLQFWEMIIDTELYGTRTHSYLPCTEKELGHAHTQKIVSPLEMLGYHAIWEHEEHFLANGWCGLVAI